MLRRLARRIALAAAVLATTLAATPAPQHRSLPQHETRQLVPAPVIARPALWKIAGAGTTIYLFGTIHALPKGIEWFDGPVASAFDGSQELVTEIVASDSAQMQSAFAAKAMLPPGQSLRSLLAPERRAAYEAALKANDVRPETFDRLKPWYVAIYLSALPMLREGYAPENGVEQTLDTRAKALHHPHSALETAEYQLGLFDSLPQVLQLRYLGEVVDTMPKARNEIGEMVAAWKRGDADSLARLMNEDADDPALTQLLVANRNKAWAEWIRQRLDRPGTVFLAVGAGHLAGRGSVQDMLAARGISATRLQ